MASITFDRETTRVEHVCNTNVLDLKGRRFDRARRNDYVAFLLQDTLHPSDCVLGLVGWFHRKNIVVLGLELASFVRP